MMKKQCEGVTLFELVVVLAIVSVVTMIGLPSFNQTIRSTRLTTSANELVTTLSVARSEAVKRNQRVVVQKTGANWENGWLAFVDINSNNSLDGVGDVAACAAGNECILQVHEALSGSYTLRGNINFTNFIAYTSLGLSNNMGRFVLCDNSDGNNVPEPYTAKLILVNFLGRVRVSTIDADNDGIPEDDSSPSVEITSCLP